MTLQVTEESRQTLQTAPWTSDESLRSVKRRSCAERFYAEQIQTTRRHRGSEERCDVTYRPNRNLKYPQKLEKLLHRTSVKRINLSLHTSWSVTERSKIQLHSFITSVLDRDVKSISHSSRFTPRGRTPVPIVQNAGRASELEWTVLAMIKIFFLIRDSHPRPSSRNPPVSEAHIFRKGITCCCTCHITINIHLLYEYISSCKLQFFITSYRPNCLTILYVIVTCNQVFSICCYVLIHY